MYTKQYITFICTAILAFVTLTACRKNVEAGTIVRASGIVFDKVKNKTIAGAKLYLYGAHSTFYGINYVDGPLDSTVSDNSGKFFIQYTAKGNSIDYGLELERYNTQAGHIANYKDPIFRFNYSTNVTDGIVQGLELNYIKIRLKVLANPFDSFYVRSNTLDPVVLIKGQSIDTTVLIRHLPGQQNFIQYYTQSLRDTAGLAALNSIPNTHWYSILRMVRDTIQADMADTLFINKTFTSSLVIPRY